MVDSSTTYVFFSEVLKYERVLSIVSGSQEANVTCRWKSYVVVIEDGRILFPEAGMGNTQTDVSVNLNVKLTLGAHEVMGYKNYLGTRFEVRTIAKFLTKGTDFDSINMGSIIS